MGYVDPNDGHRVGAERIKELLRWCDGATVKHVTLWLLSTDNLSRPAQELDPLLQIIENLAAELADERNPWQLRMVGALDLLPAASAQALKAAQERTVERTGGAQVSLAVGYGGRREIADAVRSLLHEHAKAGTTIEELAEILDVDHLSDHLYTRGLPGPALVTARRASSGCRASCSGRARTRSSTSAMCTGRASAAPTSCAPCAPTPTASAATAPERGVWE